MIIWEGSRFLDFSACCKIFCVPPSLRNYAASSIYLTKIVCWAERGGHSIVACKFQRGRQTRRDLCLRAFTLQCQKKFVKRTPFEKKTSSQNRTRPLGLWCTRTSFHLKLSINLYTIYILCHVKQVLKTCLALRPTISVDTMTAFISPSIFLYSLAGNIKNWPLFVSCLTPR